MKNSAVTAHILWHRINISASKWLSFKKVSIREEKIAAKRKKAKQQSSSRALGFMYSTLGKFMVYITHFFRHNRVLKSAASISIHIDVTL